MKSSRGKFLVLAAVLMLVASPVMAEDHQNETEEDEGPEDDSDIEEEEDENETESDDSDTDGTDNSTELTVSESEAEQTARNALSDNNWTLEESDVDEEDGYYKFEFVVSGEDAEAEIRVDGSSGEVFRLEEELEKEGNERAVQARIEAKQDQIERFRQKISELQEEIKELRENGTVEGSESEAEVEVRRDGQETKVEAEAEQGEREAEVEVEGPNQNAKDSVNGTPGNDQANEKRPGFVSNFLSGFFN